MALWADALSAAISTPPAGARHYLIVNAAVVTLTELRRLIAPEAIVLDLIHASPVAWSQCASPLLVACPTALAGSADEIRWRSFALRWRYANAFILLRSHQPMDVLARELSSRTRVQLEGQRGEWVLRYFDTRVWFPLLQTLASSPRAAFLSTASDWIVADRWGDAHAVAGAQDVAGAHQPPLMLTQGQESALMRAAEADAVVDLLLRRAQPTLMSLLPPEQHALVSRALAQADDVPLLDWPDRVTHCDLYLHLGPTYLETSPWREAAADHLSGRSTFAEACEAACEAVS